METHDCVSYLLSLAEKRKKADDKYDEMEQELLLCKRELRATKDVLYYRQNLIVWNRHHKKVLRVAFSPDSKLICSASFDGTAKICNARGHVATLVCSSRTGHQVRNAIFSPDGQVVVVAEECCLYIYRVYDNWSRVCKLELHSSPIFGLAFSPDGKYLFSSDSDVCIWSSIWGTQVRHCEHRIRDVGRGKPIFALVCSPDGKYLFCAVKGEVEVYFVGSWKKCEANLYTVHQIFDLAVSPDGKYIVTAKKGILVAWEIGTWVQVLSFENFAGEITGISFTPSSKHLVVTSWQNFKIWILEVGGDWCICRVLDGVPGTEGFGGVVSPDGKSIAAGNCEGKVCVWDTNIFN
jgi:WD40 repeat protein